MLSASLRILVVDDFEPWRRLLCSFLSENPSWEVVGQVSNGQEALEQCIRLQPDLVLLDLGLPGLNGLEAARQIRKLAPATKILFVSANLSPAIVREAFDAGALGYVFKGDACTELRPAIEIVVTGKQFLGDRFRAEDSPADS